MRKFLHRSLFIAAFGVVPVLQAEVSVVIVQPYENVTLPYLRRSFVFGSVTPPTATLSINGAIVKPYVNGGFFTMVPLESGVNSLLVVASDGLSVAIATRTVVVATAPFVPPLNYTKIDPLLPKAHLIVRPGDTIDASFQGAPGGKASFKISSGSEWFVMEEDRAAAGTYKGVCRVQAGDHLKDSDVQFQLVRADGKKFSGKAGVKISMQNAAAARIIELKEDAILLTGPDADLGYSQYLLPGTRLEVTGQKGDFLRVALSNTESGWIRASVASELPAGTPAPRSVSRNVRVKAVGESTIVEIPLQARHAFRVDQYVRPHRIKLTLYGVTADTDRIRYKNQDTVIDEISWRQESPEVMAFDIRTHQDLGWGYDVRYEGTVLVLELRHRPAAVGGSLQGVRVAVDAGHSLANYGTIGPLGNTEAAVNLDVARAVKEALEKRGAKVLMTQPGENTVSLPERSALAWRERAQFFISIHCDACELNQDPHDLEGYSVHYYHPQSHELAEAVHRVYGRRTAITDQGVWRSNLAVCRASQMPSILLEQGFLILPETEAALITPKHRHDTAEALAEALSAVLKAGR